MCKPALRLVPSSQPLLQETSRAPPGPGGMRNSRNPAQGRRDETRGCILLTAAPFAPPRGRLPRLMLTPARPQRQHWSSVGGGNSCLQPRWVVKSSPREGTASGQGSDFHICQAYFVPQGLRPASGAVRGKRCSFTCCKSSQVPAEALLRHTWHCSGKGAPPFRSHKERIQ